MSLSDHFTLIELTKSQTAERLGIDNTPDDEAIGNLASMCDNVLEPIRAHFGVPFSPSSAYRSKKLNEAIGDDLLEPRGQVLTFQAGKGYMNGLPG